MCNTIWERYRPATLSDIVLPEKLTAIAERGLIKNYLFYSSSGMGKTSLMRILLEDHPHMILDKKVTVEFLRTDVDEFCRKMLAFGDYKNETKVVYFEEFDNAGWQLQLELKAFIEKYSNVRFVATCNNISAIDAPILSRFTPIDFTFPQAEKKKLKERFANRAWEICRKDGIKISPQNIQKIVNNRFPDMRNIWDDIEVMSIYDGEDADYTVNGETELYRQILESKDNFKLWDYLYKEWSDSVVSAFSALGRPFVLYIQENHPKHERKLGNLIITLSEYSDQRLSTALDPFVTLYSLVMKYKSIINNE